jgi:broad specificity phosphatase PhoE
MMIKLVRHGQSTANTGEVQIDDIGDHNIALTDVGHEQAREAARRTGASFLQGALA